jgi:hypothetical protein
VNTDPTHHNVDRPPLTRHDLLNNEVQDLYPFPIMTTRGRFNLVRPSLQQQNEYAHDVIVRTELSERSGQRLMMVEAAAFDQETYDTLQVAGIPQLPLINATPTMRVMSVPRGAKLLSHEPRFQNRESSGTYISDRETYALAGKIFGAAWRVSNKLLLSNPGDSPLNHLAITNFPDEQGRYMYLCPPYGDGIGGLNQNNARELFVQGLRCGSGARRLPPNLEDAAITGFNEMSEFSR